MAKDKVCPGYQKFNENGNIAVRHNKKVNSWYRVGSKPYEERKKAVAEFLNNMPRIA